MKIDIHISEAPKSRNTNGPSSQRRSTEDPSPGFLLVVAGLLAYMFNNTGFFNLAWLNPVPIVLVVIGFIVLMLETLKKIHWK